MKNMTELTGIMVAIRGRCKISCRELKVIIRYSIESTLAIRKNNMNPITKDDFSKKSNFSEVFSIVFTFPERGSCRGIGANKVLE